MIPNFKPCPIELSSYMETSFVCLDGNLIRELNLGEFAKLCESQRPYLRTMLQACIYDLIREIAH